MITLKNINSAFVFFLELWMLYAFAIYGYNSGTTTVLKYLWAVLLPATVITLWAIWAAPKSSRRLKPPYQYLFRIALFLLAAYFLYAVNQPKSALIMASLAILTQVIAWYYKD